MMVVPLTCHKCGSKAIGYIDAGNGTDHIGYCKWHEPLSESVREMRIALRVIGHHLIHSSPIARFTNWITRRLTQNRPEKEAETP